MKPLLFNILFAVSCFSATATIKTDSAFIGGVKVPRLYFGTEVGTSSRNDSVFSIRDTAKIMKADSGYFGKIITPSCSLTTISADSIHVRKMVFLPTSEPTVAGALVNDSANRVFCSFTNGILGHFNRTIFTTTGDMKDSNTTTDTNIITTGVGTSLLPANWFRVGKRLKFRAIGYFTTKTPTPGAVTITYKLGTTAILTTGAITFSAGATGNYWQTDASITCRTAGAPGTVSGSSCFMFQDAAAGNDPILGVPMVNKAPISLTTTGALQFGFFVKWATADVANLFVCTSFILEEIN